MRIGGRGHRNTHRGFADMAEEDFALGRRHALHRRDDGVDQAVLQRFEVVRLPVVARTRRQQGIEGLLPGRVGHGAQMFAVGLAQPAHHLYGLRPLVQVARVADGEGQDGLAMHGFRQERQRRRQPHHGPYRHCFGHGLQRLAILHQRLSALFQRQHHQSPVDLRPDGMKLKFEHGDHAEIAAAASDCPEQVFVVLRAGVQQFSIRGDDIRRQQVVDAQAEPAAEPAEPAPQSQARDPGRRIDAEGNGQAESLGFVVKVGQGCAGFDIGSGGLGIDPHRLHRRKIDHQSVIADGGAGDVVASAADGNQQIVLTPEIHGLAHVGRARATHDDGGTAVYHGVPDFSGIVVAGISGHQDLAS
ncbi:hypothetical protein D3C71_461680 [compost metagenome]